MKILDLFSGAGGSAMGMHQAIPDAEIVGVDIRPQPRYPFVFVQADAMTFDLAGFDFVWASPPCQRYTCLRSMFDSSRYPDLVDAIRAKLDASGLPYVIENVMGAPLRPDLVLCGNSFGLRVYRHRLFELSFPVWRVHHNRHVIRTNARHSQRGRKAAFLRGSFASITGNAGSYCGSAMGIDWMTGRELSQAVPPAYSRYILSAYRAQMAGEETTHR